MCSYFWDTTLVLGKRSPSPAFQLNSSGSVIARLALLRTRTSDEDVRAPAPEEPGQLLLCIVTRLCFHASMKPAALADLVASADRWLETPRRLDYEKAANGLQAENNGRVTRIAAAVDARQATVEAAIARGADLLLVHHGLFWNPTHPWTGRRWQLIKLLAHHNLAIYSSHLPLDAHPILGNNAQLCRALRLKNLRPFFFTKNQFIGFKARADISRETLAERVAAATGDIPLVIPAGPRRCRSIGVVTGGAGSELQLAASEGVDTFITGEGPHWTHVLADQLGINVIYGGHYQTETFGVKALAKALARKFHLPWEFIDYPTGL